MCELTLCFDFHRTEEEAVEDRRSVMTMPYRTDGLDASRQAWQEASARRLQRGEEEERFPLGLLGFAPK